jgi:hypothetical protein
MDDHHRAAAGRAVFLCDVDALRLLERGRYVVGREGIVVGRFAAVVGTADY